MITNLLAYLVLFGLLFLFVWLAWKASKAKNAALKWGGVFFSGLLALLFTAIIAVSFLGFYRINVAPHNYTVADVRVAASPEMLSRGEKIAALCSDCHSSTGTAVLDGSADNFVAEGPPVGVIYGTNLTPGGPLKDWSDGEIIRAIREGVDNRGRPLIIMPSMAFRFMSDEDVNAIVAYLRSQPTVERDLPERDLNILAALFIGTGMFPTSAQTPVVEPIIAPPAGTPEHGSYLVTAFGCKDCHGLDLAGLNDEMAGIFGPNLTVIMPYRSEENFMSLFREGKDPNGRLIDTKMMPWKSYGNLFSDEELKDIYAYLRTLEPMAVSR